MKQAERVSIPNGLPRPFSLWGEKSPAVDQYAFQSRTGFPGHLAATSLYPGSHPLDVSIPNGLPRPFSQWAIFSAKHYIPAGFNPERASQAI